MTFRLEAPPPTQALAFANTRYWRGSPAPTETLVSLAVLLDWCERAGGAPAALVHAFGREAARDEDGALAAAVALREAVHALLDAQAGDAPPPAAAVAAFRQALGRTPARHALVRDAQGYRWEVEARPATLEAVLAPVLWSAADLLAGEGRARLKRCANDQCRWLFLDDSKSGNRRWCSMSACGNRAKAARHYHAHKERAG